MYHREGAGARPGRGRGRSLKPSRSRAAGPGGSYPGRSVQQWDAAAGTRGARERDLARARHDRGDRTTTGRSAAGIDPVIGRKWKERHSMHKEAQRSRLECGPGSCSWSSALDLMLGGGRGQVFACARHVDGRAASLPRSDARCACHVDGRLLRASSVSAPWRAPVRRGHTCRHHVRGSARFVFSVRSGHLGALREHVLVQEEKARRIRGHRDVLDRPRHVDAVEFRARKRAERRVPEGDVPRYLAEM